MAQKKPAATPKQAIKRVEVSEVKLLLPVYNNFNSEGDRTWEFSTYGIGNDAQVTITAPCGSSAVFSDPAELRAIAEELLLKVDELIQARG